MDLLYIFDKSIQAYLCPIPDTRGNAFSVNDVSCEFVIHGLSYVEVSFPMSIF